MAEAAKEHASLPFSLRNLVPALGEPGARLGVVEPVKHGILRPFPVLFEKEGAAVAHFQFSVLLLSGGTLRVTGLDLPAFIKSDKPRTLTSCWVTCIAPACVACIPSTALQFRRTLLLCWPQKPSQARRRRKRRPLPLGLVLVETQLLLGHRHRLLTLR